MTSRRMPWLLAALVALAVVRWRFPPEGAPAAPVAEAVARRSPAPTLPAAPAPERAAEPAMPASAVDEVVADAFAVRMPPAPPAPPPPPPAPKPVAEPPPAPAPPPPPPPPPLQVIGTWDDAKAPGVFLASPRGTVLARAGTILMAEYRVTAITPQQISLVHVTSQHTWHLPVPRPPARP